MKKIIVFIFICCSINFYGQTKKDIQKSIEHLDSSMELLDSLIQQITNNEKQKIEIEKLEKCLADKKKDIETLKNKSDKSKTKELSKEIDNLEIKLDNKKANIVKLNKKIIDLNSKVEEQKKKINKLKPLEAKNKDLADFVKNEKTSIEETIALFVKLDYEKVDMKIIDNLRDRYQKFELNNSLNITIDPTKKQLLKTFRINIETLNKAEKILEVKYDHDKIKNHLSNVKNLEITDFPQLEDAQEKIIDDLDYYCINNNELLEVFNQVKDYSHNKMKDYLNVPEIKEWINDYPYLKKQWKSLYKDKSYPFQNYLQKVSCN